MCSAAGVARFRAVGFVHVGREPTGGAMPVRRTTGRSRCATSGSRSDEPPGVARWFGPEPSEIAAARGFVGALVEDPNVRCLAELLVSELATNALVHARSGFEVRVRHGPRLRVEVRDESTAGPVLRIHHPGATGGRGLRLVHALASACGWERRSHGKVVWFEL